MIGKGRLRYGEKEERSAYDDQIREEMELRRCNL
jgi:hypothetical protein